MSKQPNKRTDWRAISSLVMLLSLGFVVVTGVLLHVVLDRPGEKYVPREVSSVHLGMALLFVLAGICHIVLNRRAIARYMVATNPGQGVIRKELVVAFLLVIGVLVLAIVHSMLGA